MQRGVRSTTEIFIAEARNVHGDKYNYSLVNYINNSSKIEIVCPIHGSWFQTPSNHLRGKGCKKCASLLQTSNTKDFIRKATILHGNRYNYSKVMYVRVDYDVEIICYRHGSFFQTPDAHLHSNGCFECGREACGNSIVNDNNYFIMKATEIHNGKYDYSKTIYTKNRESVIIICPTHGEFTQMAMAHLAGKGCKICAHSVSNKETKWLDLLCIPKENRNISIYINDTWIKPDGYDPLTKTIYEFYGDFWHGNPNVFDHNSINLATKKTFGELYQQTLDREKMIIAAGYSLITIWESNFENKNGN